MRPPSTLRVPAWGARQPPPGCARGCEHVFVTSQGSPHARFERALRSGNATLVRAAAAQLPRIGVDDALRICVAREHEHYGRAAVRWLGRLLLEQPGITLAEAQFAATALSVLPHPARDASVLAAFGLFCEERGLSRSASALADLAERSSP